MIKLGVQETDSVSTEGQVRFNVIFWRSIYANFSILDEYISQFLLRKIYFVKMYIFSLIAVKCKRKYQGSCENYGEYQLALYTSGTITIEDCHFLCYLAYPRCHGFYLSTHESSQSKCYLFKEGCQQKTNVAWDYYEMDDCEGIFFILWYQNYLRIFCTNINWNLQRSSQLYTFQSTPAGENGDHALRAVMGALGPVLESVFSRIPKFPFLKDTVM